MGKLPANVGTVSCRTRAGGRRLPAPGRTTLRIVHDENYKRLFAFPRLVEDLLRVVGESEWLVRCDTAEEFLARALPSPDEGEPAEV